MFAFVKLFDCWQYLFNSKTMSNPYLIVQNSFSLACKSIQMLSQINFRLNNFIKGDVSRTLN